MALKHRENFTEEQIESAFQRQGGLCPCCQRSLSHVGCGFDAHHRNGDRSDSRGSNLVLCCVDCHHNCYHDEKGISRKPVNCRLSVSSKARPQTGTRTGRQCGCGGCGNCTSPYRVCTTEIRVPYARLCSYCA